ncbi:MAG: hypothetical protein JXA90_09835, partial [Planctomycetes bacterium]|nr:hypothetical protein [Planctomycetota bacterium]
SPRRGAGRWIPAAILISAGLALAVSAVRSRAVIVEQIHLWSISSADPKRAGEAIRRLRRAGLRRSVGPLLEIVETREDLREDAIRALAEISARVSEPERLRILEGILPRAVAGEPAAYQAAGEVAEGVMSGPEMLARALEARFDEQQAEGAAPARGVLPRGRGDPFLQLAAAVLLRTWPGSRPQMERLLSRERLTASSSILECFRTAATGLKILEVPAASAGDALRHVVRHHPHSEIRALALAHAMDRREAYRWSSLLVDAYRSDASFTVRRAAVRIGCAVGPVPGGLDLRVLLLDESDPHLLREVIEARIVELTAGASSRVVPLLDDLSFAFTSARSPAAAAAASTLSAKEVERLRSILAESGDAELRDAASRALLAQDQDSTAGTGNHPAATGTAPRADAEPGAQK